MIRRLVLLIGVKSSPFILTAIAVFGARGKAAFDINRFSVLCCVASLALQIWLELRSRKPLKLNEIRLTVEFFAQLAGFSSST